MERSIEEFTYARIAGLNALVETYEFDAEADLWETTVVHVGDGCDGRDITTVRPGDLIPLVDAEGFGGLPGRQLPEWFSFDYGVWPAPRYNIELVSPPGSTTMEITLQDGFSCDLKVAVEIDTIQPELDALFAFVSSHRWERNYQRLILDGYSWGLEMVIGDTHYVTGGINGMPEFLPNIAPFLDSLVEKAMGASVAEDHPCPPIVDHEDCDDCLITATLR